MILYAVADIHGRSARLDMIRWQIDRFRPDVLVAAGDLTGAASPGRLLDFFESLPTPVLAVRGNCDSPRFARNINGHFNTRVLHRSSVSVNGVVFAGLSGTLPIPFRSTIGFRDASLFARFGETLARADVLVAHPPPYGVLDRVFGRFSAGCRGLARAVVQHQPPLVICGHIHENSGAAMVGDTVIVNCSIGKNGKGALIDYQKGAKPAVEML